MALKDLFKLPSFGRNKETAVKHERITGDGVLQLDSHDRKLIQALFGHVNAPSNYEEQLEVYASNVDIYSIIRKIVQPASALEYYVERKNGDTWEKVENTPLNSLLEAPNPVKGYTWSQYVEMCLTYLLASGNLYQYKGESVGFGVRTLDVLPSQFVEINTSNNFFMPLQNYSLEFDTVNQNFTTEEIIHTKYIRPNYRTINEMVYGLSPIKVAAMVAQVGLDRWEADASLLHNKGAIGLLTNRSDLGMTPTQQHELQKDWNAATAGAKNFGKVKVSNANVDFVQLAMSSTDLQLLEKDVVTLRAACNVYGVPSVLLNDPGNRTYNNLKEANKTLWTGAIMPNVELFLDDLNRNVSKTIDPSGNTRISANYKEVEALQEDLKEKADTYKVLIDSGVQSPQQAAEAMHLEQPDESAARTQSRTNQNNN